MKKKASNFKPLPSQKIKILHTQKVAPVFNFYRALHFGKLNTSISLFACFLQRSQYKKIRLILSNGPFRYEKLFFILLPQILHPLHYRCLLPFQFHLAWSAPAQR